MTAMKTDQLKTVMFVFFFNSFQKKAAKFKYFFFISRAQVSPRLGVKFQWKSVFKYAIEAKGKKEFLDQKRLIVEGVLFER